MENLKSLENYFPKGLIEVVRYSEVDGTKSKCRKWTWTVIQYTYEETVKEEGYFRFEVILSPTKELVSEDNVTCNKQCFIQESLIYRFLIILYTRWPSVLSDPFYKYKRYTWVETLHLFLQSFNNVFNYIY